MARSNFFNTYENNTEQTMLDDLVAESVNIYGEDCYYLPRTLKHYDPIYGQSDVVEYNTAHMVPMYLVNVDGFTGEGNFLSKFGLEIRDQVIWSTSQRTFADEVAAVEPVEDLTRPREGDLIWFPLNHKLFQIMYVDKFENFYQLGALQTWQMRTELFEYSGEKFNTGIPELDALTHKHSPDLIQWAVHDENHDYLMTEDGDIWVDEVYGVTNILDTKDNVAIQAHSNTFVDTTVKDPFSEGNI